MNIQDFIKNFSNEFDETPAEQIMPETKFRELEEWSSLIALSIIAFVDQEYDVRLTGDEIRKCETVNDIYATVANKVGE